MLVLNPPKLTEKELEIMKCLWHNGPMYVKEMVKEYPEPRPHVNTIATLAKILERKGHIAHDSISGSFLYYALTREADVREAAVRELVETFFDGNPEAAIQALRESWATRP